MQYQIQPYHITCTKIYVNLSSGDAVIFHNYNIAISKQEVVLLLINIYTRYIMTMQHILTECCIYNNIYYQIFMPSENHFKYQILVCLRYLGAILMDVIYS